VAAEPISPLQVIQHKELDLSRRVEEARRQAEARIQAAREEARQIIAQADQEGRSEADAFYQRGIEAARREAETVVAAAHQEADALRCQATAGLDDAARHIVDMVLPPEASSG
jgi:V/A-type H+-transporting ATPase subunit G/H